MLLESCTPRESSPHEPNPNPSRRCGADAQPPSFSATLATSDLRAVRSRKGRLPEQIVVQLVEMMLKFLFPVKSSWACLPDKNYRSACLPEMRRTECACGIVPTGTKTPVCCGQFW